MVLLAIVGTSLWMLPLMPWALAAWLVLFALIIAWRLSLRPKLNADWAAGMEMLPRAEIVDDTMRVRQFRNFHHAASGETIPRYEERTYALSGLSSLDYFLSH
jgi:hypothetical protein